MGLDILDLIFWWIGRVFWKMIKIAGRRSNDLSDGAYEVIGFVVVCVIVFCLISIWVV